MKRGPSAAEQERRQGLPCVGEYRVDAAAGVFRRFTKSGFEVETVPMRSWEGQRLLVQLGDKHAVRAVLDAIR